MSLDHFLQNTRPTPSARYRLQHRHAEGGHWTEVASAASPEGLDEEVAAGISGWVVEAHPGDLVEAVRPDGTAGGLYGVNALGGLRPLPPVSLGWSDDPAGWTWARTRTWPTAWEKCPEAGWMLTAARTTLPRADVVRAAVACARAALSTVRAPELPEAEAALSAVQAWLRDPSPERLAASLRAGESSALAERSDAPAARAALLTALMPVNPWLATEVARLAARAMAEAVRNLGAGPIPRREALALAQAHLADEVRWVLPPRAGGAGVAVAVARLSVGPRPLSPRGDGRVRATLSPP